VEERVAARLHRVADEHDRVGVRDVLAALQPGQDVVGLVAVRRRTPGDEDERTNGRRDGGDEGDERSHVAHKDNDGALSRREQTG